MRIGEYQKLKVERESPHGYYLADDEAEVLLPRGLVPVSTQIGDELEVFVYTDSEDRNVATTRRPYATVGQFAMLQLVTLTPNGAFFDWGLEKDLFCPVREQIPNMKEGSSYLVRVYLDEVSQRVTCTLHLNKFLRPDGEDLEPGQAVKIMVSGQTREAIQVIVDGRVRGSIFPDEIHERLNVGDVRDAFVKKVRSSDGKVAISLRPQGYRAVIGERDRVLQALRAAGGYLPVNDKTDPAEIQKRFGLSKGAFKKLIGSLYKEGAIELEAYGIRLRR